MDFIRKIEFKFISNYLIFVLLTLYFIVNYEFYYILNDELVFDVILLSLVFFIYIKLKNSSKLESNIEDENYKNFLIFIIVYLKNWQLFLLRKKKFEKIILLNFLNTFKKFILEKLVIYIHKLNLLVLDNINNETNNKIHVLNSNKNVNLTQNIFNSFKNKLFILN